MAETQDTDLDSFEENVNHWDTSKISSHNETLIQHKTTKVLRRSSSCISFNKKRAREDEIQKCNLQVSKENNKRRRLESQRPDVQETLQQQAVTETDKLQDPTTQNAKKNMRDGLADKPNTKDKTEVCKDVSGETIISPKFSDSSDQEVIKLDPLGILTCPHASCNLDAISVMLHEECPNLCQAQLLPKLRESVLKKNLCGEIYSVLNIKETSIEDLKSLISQKLEDFLKRDDVVQCPHAVDLFEEEGLLKTIHNDDRLDVNNHFNLEKAKCEFKKSGCQAGILFYITDKVSHRVNLKLEGDKVNTFDYTNGRQTLIGFDGNVRRLYVQVLEKGENGKFKIAEVFPKSSSSICKKQLEEGHVNNLQKREFDTEFTASMVLK
ncbi:uncharacterized protein LOC124452729 isoform X2 [Xenia sp. Carnegie-2017]|uniref:uncharacterized protein LOC124452729 isoform X2 n=1 Tax=Xenia sp. Carnegie-2017 TaxID=2897299 RepID=UPI001F048277|nr:uncharacterized protein LOC124452729 isoform X2 [Xenia sp. Carnegie-2017]